MHKYHGTLIHKTRDEDGDIEVVDDGYYRSLHFGTDPQQSCMLLRDPIHLALAYTRAMTCALLLQEPPRRVLLIGLGGGSLAKFLLHHLPGVSIDAVESRPAVAEVARSHFELSEDARLKLHIDDGGSYIRRHSDDGETRYDTIFVDAFIGAGIARSVCGISFLQACHNLLDQDGILSMNLWNGDFITAREMLQDIRESFDNNVLQLPVDGKDNTIALASRGQSLKRRLKRAATMAQTLEAQTGIEYKLLLKQLKKHNGWQLF